MLKGLFMNKKKIILSIIIGLLVFSLINKRFNRKEDIETFNESFINPEFYRILDIDKWTEKKSPMNYTELENAKIKVTSKDKKDIESITNILNSNTLSTVKREVFSQYWDDVYKKDRFWLYIFIDTDKLNDGYYPANIIIDDNLTFCVQAVKGKDEKILKGKMSQDEFNLIEKIYKKEEKVKS